jgi:hypothetical protein
MKWSDNAYKIQMNPGIGYTSCFDLNRLGRIKQYKDLCCYNKTNKKVDKIRANLNINEIKNEIHNRFTSPIYHIIRTPNGFKSDIVMKNFKRVFRNNTKYIKYDKDSDVKNINTILSKPPKNHTFIFITPLEI